MINFKAMLAAGSLATLSLPALASSEISYCDPRDQMHTDAQLEAPNSYQDLKVPTANDLSQVEDQISVALRDQQITKRLQTLSTEEKREIVDGAVSLVKRWKDSEYITGADAEILNRFLTTGQGLENLLQTKMGVATAISADLAAAKLNGWGATALDMAAAGVHGGALALLMGAFALAYGRNQYKWHLAFAATVIFMGAEALEIKSADLKESKHVRNSSINDFFDAINLVQMEP